MRSMMLPLTSTLDGAESEPLLPSKIRTFWNSVALAFADGLPCARAAEASARDKSGSATTRIRREMEVMRTPPEQKSQLVNHCRVIDARRFRLADPYRRCKPRLKVD